MAHHVGFVFGAGTFGASIITLARAWARKDIVCIWKLYSRRGKRVRYQCCVHLCIDPWMRKQ